MAEENPKEKTGNAPEEPQPKGAAKETDTSDLLSGDDDLMDLFDDTEEVNEELALLTAGLDDVDIGDLLAQVRDIRGILDRR